MSNRSPATVSTNNEKYEVAARNPLAMARIISHVRYEDDCWIWTGAHNGRGYAVGTSNKQLVYIHRLAHWIVRGPVQDGMVLDHLCRRPSCVNPLHTEVVTSGENTRRGVGNGSQTHCPQDHQYDETNTRYHTDKLGYTRRMCIACQNIRNAAYRAKGPNRKAAQPLEAATSGVRISPVPRRKKVRSRRLLDQEPRETQARKGANC